MTQIVIMKYAERFVIKGLDLIKHEALFIFSLLFLVQKSMALVQIYYVCIHNVL